MGKILNTIGLDQQEWIEKQKIFFVASAPLDSKGTVNTSPKGYDCFRIMNPNQVCYLELTGSGIETQSHVEENGRITIMFLAFESAPKILRLLGRGRVCRVDTPEFQALYNQYFAGSELEQVRGLRSIIVLNVEKVGISCGFGVPYYEYKGNRPTLKNYWGKKTGDQVTDFWVKENASSLDGLPGMRHAHMGPKFVHLAGSTSALSWLTNWTGLQPLTFGASLAAAFGAGIALTSLSPKR
ncbi:hypothetical protein BGX27_007350 [Mortierella sp. AM989]|nr:hypothetical protein BGX27_007350 [Mortierella sp. AM989]